MASVISAKMGKQMEEIIMKILQYSALIPLTSRFICHLRDPSFVIAKARLPSSQDEKFLCTLFLSDALLFLNY